MRVSAPFPPRDNVSIYLMRHLSIWYVPCHTLFLPAGNEVIPGTNCQVYLHCSGGDPTSINQCVDGFWYDSKSDSCEALSQGISVDCLSDPDCPTSTQSNSTTGSSEVVPSGMFLPFSPYCNICIENTHLLFNCGAFLASIEIENPSFSPQTQQPIVTPCANGFSGNEAVPCTGCKVYNECWMGIVQSTKECGSPLVFDEVRDYCNFPSEVSCPLGEGCVVSYSPTGSPTENSFTGAFVGCLILYISYLVSIVSD
jgi:hypothetical protein